MPKNRSLLPETGKTGWSSRDLGRMFEDFFSPIDVQSPVALNPPCDIEDRDGNFLLVFDLPGLSKDDVKIKMQDNQLIVSGERKEDFEKKEGSNIFYRERNFGSFVRSFTLPASVDPNKIEARYQDGVLQIVLPKSAAVHSKIIEVKEGKPSTEGKKKQPRVILAAVQDRQDHPLLN